MKLTVVLAPEDDGGYTVVLPAIEGCVSQGDTLEEALANIKEAALGCLDVMRRDGATVAAETPEIIAREVQRCLEDRRDEGLPLTIETREIEIEAEVAV
jgi:predicted RNase H-like HicB family nuclease